MIALAAMAKNRVIGNGDKMPWHSKEDFAFFKEKTMGGQLVMGRKTFEGLPKPLKGRVTWVLNTSKFGGDVTVNENGAEEGVIYTAKAHYIPNSAIVCGGASIYEQFLPHCHTLFLTEFDFDAEGDVYMPAFEHLFKNKELIKEITNGRIYRYTR